MQSFKEPMKGAAFLLFFTFFLTHSSPHCSVSVIQCWAYLFSSNSAWWLKLKERGWFALAWAECLGSVPQCAAVSNSPHAVETLTQNYQLLCPFFYISEVWQVGFNFCSFSFTTCERAVKKVLSLKERKDTSCGWHCLGYYSTDILSRKLSPTFGCEIITHTVSYWSFVSKLKKLLWGVVNIAGTWLIYGLFGFRLAKSRRIWMSVGVFFL